MSPADHELRTRPRSVAGNAVTATLHQFLGRPQGAVVVRFMREIVHHLDVPDGALTVDHEHGAGEQPELFDQDPVLPAEVCEPVI